MSASRSVRSSKAVIEMTPVNTTDILEGGPLFRSEFPLDDVRCLPFVRDLTAAEKKIHGPGRSFWICSPSSDYNRACEVGKLYAAAWIIGRKRNGPQWASLTWIVRDMPEENDGYSVGFMWLIATYVDQHAAQVSCERVEEHAREEIERDRKLVANALAKRRRS